MKPRDYQHKFVNDIIRKISEGYKRICCQLATGAGKTVCFSYLLSRYFAKKPSAKVVIIVHREELQEQTKKALSKFGITHVQVDMVETFNNRLKKQGHVDYDMIIIDECHIGNFRKVIDHYKDDYPQTVIIGFSATPVSASKKTPLYGDYETICTGVDINDLIDKGFLCPAIHYNPITGIDKKSIKKTAGEYNMASMAIEFSKPKLIDAVVHAYESYCKGKKTLIFNTTIEHSNLVHECFKNSGYPSRSLDSNTATPETRKETLKWLKETPNAILNNVGILTAGFDEPTIEAVIFNRTTKSLPLWLQCCGRGARLSPETDKESFIIIDLGDNINGEQHHQWHFRHDWKERFLNPDKPGDGAPPMKNCPQCEAMIYMAATKCDWCGHLMPRETVYSDMAIELAILPDKPIKRNSQTALNEALDITAQKVSRILLPPEQRRELLGTSIRKVYEMSSFEPKNYVIKHLTQVYATKYCL